jgi:hypothetical protein
VADLDFLLTGMEDIRAFSVLPIMRSALCVASPNGGRHGQV